MTADSRPGRIAREIGFLVFGLIGKYELKRHLVYDMRSASVLERAFPNFHFPPQATPHRSKVQRKLAEAPVRFARLHRLVYSKIASGACLIFSTTSSWGRKTPQTHVSDK